LFLGSLSVHLPLGFASSSVNSCIELTMSAARTVPAPTSMSTRRHRTPMGANAWSGQH